MPQAFERFYNDPGPFAADGAGLSNLGIPAMGNINVQISAAGVQPGATANDNVLAVFSLPANLFDRAGRGVSILAQGSLVNNANNKRIKIIYAPTTAVVGSAVTGGTTIADTGTITTVGGGWSIEANVFKYGNGPGSVPAAAPSNTQIGIHQQAQAGLAVDALVSPVLLTAPENAAIRLAVTGNAGTATTDITFNFLSVTAMN